MNIMNEIHVVN